MGSTKTAKRIAIGAAIAGAAGYVTGMLTAPKSGKKTRDQLKQSAGASLGDVEKQLKGLHSELGSMVDDARDSGQKLQGRTQKKFGNALDEAKTSKDKLKNVLSALHAGEADDADLQRALKDAKHALDHLKDFIKK